MADDGGFQLNISTSSSAPRVQKKKKATFHAKKNAKRAKVKAQAMAPASGGPAVIKPTPKPTPTQLQQGAGGGEKRFFVKQMQTAPVTKKRGVVSFTNSSAAVKRAPVAEISVDGQDMEQDDEDDEQQPVPQSAEEMSDDGDDAQETNDQLEGETTDALAGDAAVEAEGEGKKSAFGTRRNPNKDAYVPEAFTTVRTKMIDTVFDKPLESSASEKIFAHATFQSMQLHPRLVDILQKEPSNGGFGFARPTTVQVKTIPLILSGKDVLVKSETGSGKTLSYLLPIVQKLQSIEPRVGRQDGCLALILAPTRELCQQIEETADKLTKAFVFLVPGSVVGGEKKKSEKARLRKGICILIATPGRLADHLVNTQSFNYSRLQFLVLDEADRLLDMGFQKQITQILSIIDASTKSNQYTGGRRQNLLVSATVNSGVQELAKMSLHNPVLVDADKEVAKKERLAKESQPPAAAGGQAQVEKFSTPHQLQQHFMIVPAKLRLCGLATFLRQELNNNLNGANKTHKKCKIVVFMSTCDAVDFHFALFQKCAWPTGGKPGTAPLVASDDKKDSMGAASPMFGAMGSLFRLHGNIPQQERMSTFKNFCSSSNGVLICTDVAARGLNLPTVQWIVQYDPPTETRDYVHRVGRTARSGNQGSSLLFLMPSESEYLDYLKKHNLALNALSLEKTISRVAASGGFATSKKKLLHEIVQSDLQYLFEQTLLADAKLFELACQAFHSFVRSYATHSSDTRNIFHVRGLHFGHIAKSFALREPPASTKLRDTGKNAKQGTMQKRKDRDDKEKNIYDRKIKQQKQQHRKFAQHVSEFAG